MNKIPIIFSSVNLFESSSLNFKNCSKVIYALATLHLYFFMVYFRIRNLELDAALNGLSPMQVAILSEKPQWFYLDFPSGVSELLKSLPFMIYPFAYGNGFDVAYVWGGMVALEIAAVIFCAYWTFRILFPNVASGAAVFAGLAYSASSLITPDLGRFALPYYGWNYGFAIAAALLVVACTIRQWYFAAAGALVLTLMIHPIYALEAALFAVASFAVQVVSRKNELAWLRIALAAFLFTLAGGAWLWWLTTQGTIGGGDVDPALFVALTRAQNYHWFPLYLGVFWELHAYHLVPLVSTLALIAWSVSAPYRRNDFITQQLVAGILLLMFVCLCGIAISLKSQWPMLIKMALHRADTMALVIGMLLVIRAVWQDLLAGDALERFLSIALILVPFQIDIGMVPYAVALRVAYAAIKGWYRGELGGALVAAVLLAGSAMGLVMFYHWNGIAPDLLSRLYVGVDLLIVSAAALVVVLELATRRSEHRTLALQVAVVVVAAGLGTLRTPRFDPFANPASRAMAEAAREAQFWARDNTPVGALFMPDPGMGYFWRDLSQRPSFGTFREWLLISIMYNSRQELLTEGIRRYESLGLPFPDYILHPPTRRMSPLIERLGADASAKFYSMSADDFARFAREFGVRYFVFRATSLKGDPPVPVVFRNAHFVIGKAPD